MSQDAPQNPVTTQRVVYDMPGTDRVVLRRDVEFRGADGSALAMDVYSPPDSASAAAVPAVVIVAGYRDAGFQKMLGCRFKEMQSAISWGRLIAASGMVAITYTNAEPAADVEAVIDHVRAHAGALGIDGDRIGLWASSGNAPLALWLLTQESRTYLKCAALSYGFTLDLNGFTAVADAAKTFKFANPAEGKSMADLRTDAPLFLARAGQEQFPGLNDALDRFLTAAVARNLPVTFTNHPAGPHAFDLFHDSDASRAIVRQILMFLRAHLLATSGVRGG